MMKRGRVFSALYALAVLLVASSVVLASDETTEIVFPGGDPQKVMSIIQEILQGIEKNESQLENVFVTGELLESSGEGPLPKRFDAAHGQRFSIVLIVKKGQRRYEQEVSQIIDGKEERYTAIKIMNDKGLYRLSRKQVAIIPLRGADDDAMQWQGQTEGLSQFLTVYDLGAGRDVPVSTFLTSCIDRLGQDYFRKNRTIKCSRQGSLVTIEDRSVSKAYADYAVAQIDTAKGYGLVFAEHQLGKQGAPLLNRISRHIAIAEIAPTVFYPKKGQIDIQWSGSAIGPAGWRRTALEVKRVQFGDFDCDQSLFDPDALPIPGDAEILDYRSGKGEERGHP